MHSDSNRTGSLYLFALAAVFAAFFFLAFFRLNLLLASYDEVDITRKALLAMGGDFNELAGPLFFLPALKIPAMMGFYTGTLQNLVQIPVFMLFAPSYTAMRLPFILLSALGLLALWHCLRRWLGRWPALITLVLIVSDSMYIRTLRRGAEHEELIIINMFWIGLAFLVTGPGRAGRLRLAAAGLVWGLALWTKIHTLAYLAGAGAAYFIFGFHRRARASGRTPFSGPADIAVFAFAFCLGAAPLINEILLHFGQFSSGLMRALASPFCGINPAMGGPGARLVRRFHDLGFLFFESNLFEWLPSPSIRWPVFTLLLVLLSAAYPMLAKNRFVPADKTALAKSLFLVYAAVFACLIFTPEIMASANITSMLLLPELGAGILVWVILNSRGKTKILLALALIIPFVGITDSRQCLMRQYFAQHGRYGNYLNWTRAVTARLDALEEKPVYLTPFVQTNLLAAEWYGKPLALRRGMSAARMLRPLRTAYKDEPDELYILTENEAGRGILPNTEAPPLPGLKKEILFSTEEGFPLKKDDSRVYTLWRISQTQTGFPTQILAGYFSDLIVLGARADRKDA